MTEVHVLTYSWITMECLVLYLHITYTCSYTAYIDYFMIY